VIALNNVGYWITRSKNMMIQTFIAQEVKHQGFIGEEAITRQRFMLEAWDHARGNASSHYPVTVSTIIAWGALIEPDCNGFSSFRNGNVSVGGRICPPKEEIPTLMKFFVYSVFPSNTTPAEKYHIFELIHPFLDGNGRVGKIIYNYLNGTLDDPIFPPKFFGKDSIA